MTPAHIIRAVLSVGGFVVALVPSAAAGIIGDVFDALAPLPDLVDELGDGEWSDDDVNALRAAVADLLDAVPGVPLWHARRLAGGVAALVALIVAAARKEAPARGRRVRESGAKALETLRAARVGVRP